jgi:hypothetical protein
MLAFLMSLRHPENSSSYEEVELLLGRTLASIVRQEDDRYQIVIVGNRKPAFSLPSRARFVEVAFPPPSAIGSPKTGRSAVLLDKGTKLAVAALDALAGGATSFMIADADDFFSRKLSSFVNENPTQAGWFLDDGYQYSTRRSLCRRISSGFNDLCGSSQIFKADLVDAPNIPTTSSQDELLAAFGEEKIYSFFGSHRELRGLCRDLGSPLKPLPFAGAVYNVDTNENHSYNTFKGFGWPVTRSLSEEFDLPRGGPRELLQAAAGPITVPAGYLWRTTVRFVSPPGTPEFDGFEKNSCRTSKGRAQS